MSEVNIEYKDEVMSAEFELVGHFVLRKGAWTESTLKEWEDQLGANHESIESVINHFHIQSLFWLSEEDNLSVSEMEQIGREVKAAWENTLRASFPERNFKVTISSAAEDGWVGEMAVTVCQIRLNS
ncbi:MAG: hypothetical protein AB2788_20265 [Candidatus Thiodiazotropha endolucinida]